MANQAGWMQQAAETRREREEGLQRIERQVRSMLQLADESINMLGYLTKDIPKVDIKLCKDSGGKLKILLFQPFLVPEVVDRIAAMLNYFLVALAGPKCRDLKVCSSLNLYNTDRRSHLN